MENQATPAPEITPQPTLTPPATTPPKKSYLPLILAVIIIFAVSIFGGVLLGKYLYGPQTVAPIPTLAPKPTIIPIATPTVYTEATQSANWKIYTNKKYGYQINFPLQIGQRSVSDVEINEEHFMVGIPHSDAIVLEIKVKKKLTETSAQDWWTSNFNNIYGSATEGEIIASPKDFSIEDNTVNNLKTLRVNPKESACNSLRYIGDQYFFPKEDNVIWVNFYHDPINCKYVGLQLGEKLKSQILSTFKFLGATPTPPTTYTACGCGCCGGTTPKEQCLYKSKGDDLNKIIEEDKKATNSSQCATVGCSIGITYKYCD